MPRRMIISWQLALVSLACAVASTACRTLASGPDPAGPVTRGSAQLFPIFHWESSDRKKFGYIDAHGAVVVPAHLNTAFDFQDGLGAAWDDEGELFLDPTGAVAFRVPAWAAGAWFFSDGFCAVNKGGHREIDGVSGGVWGYLNYRV